MIGIFDSGTGGLSIYKACKAKLPKASFIYFSDHKHFPYGEKTVEQIEAFSNQIARFLMDKGAQIIILACNAATISSIQSLRQHFPIQFVGTEPAVKPASLATKTKKIAVLLTNAASAGHSYHELVSRWNEGVQVFSIPMPRLVQIMEKNIFHESSSKQYLLEELQKIQELGVDTIVLGCTHFILLKAFIREHFKDAFTVLEPTEGVSNQVKRIYNTIQDKYEADTDSFYTSGIPSVLEDFYQTWFKRKINAIHVNLDA